MSGDLELAGELRSKSHVVAALRHDHIKDLLLRAATRLEGQRDGVTVTDEMVRRARHYMMEHNDGVSFTPDEKLMRGTLTAALATKPLEDETLDALGAGNGAR